MKDIQGSLDVAVRLSNGREYFFQEGIAYNGAEPDQIVKSLLDFSNKVIDAVNKERAKKGNIEDVL